MQLPQRGKVVLSTVEVRQQRGTHQRREKRDCRQNENGLR
uniref:Uncharacterized protein n=1 Tax=uncultured bacterium A1Q1_fos_291 TaxID=1256570 RepID=L7VYB8_9BACT|nr:hypothetical protein [uncultured bacterium A1Q1_fos_291]